MINRQIAVGVDSPVLDRVEVVCNTEVKQLRINYGSFLCL